MYSIGLAQYKVQSWYYCGETDHLKSFIHHRGASYCILLFHPIFFIRLSPIKRAVPSNVHPQKGFSSIRALSRIFLDLDHTPSFNSLMQFFLGTPPKTASLVNCIVIDKSSTYVTMAFWRYAHSSICLFMEKKKWH